MALTEMLRATQSRHESVAGYGLRTGHLRLAMWNRRRESSEWIDGYDAGIASMPSVTLPERAKMDPDYLDGFLLGLRDGEPDTSDEV